jgi:hypothetical protein
MSSNYSKCTKHAKIHSRNLTHIDLMNNQSITPKLSSISQDFYFHQPPKMHHNPKHHRHEIDYTRTQCSRSSILDKKYNRELGTRTSQDKELPLLKLILKQKTCEETK